MKYIRDLEARATAGNAQSQYCLGYCYYYGKCVQQNYDAAVEWWTKASEQGYADAQYRLGFCYYHGDVVPQSYDTAVELWTKAGGQGQKDAQYRLGNCYYFGDGVQYDLSTSVEWWTKAAEQGHADSQYQLGMCYANGEGTPQNYENAAEWWLKAAEQGHIFAMQELSVCYEVGEGAPQSYEKAIELWIKTAERKDANDLYTPLTQQPKTGTAQPKSIAPGRTSKSKEQDTYVLQRKGDLDVFIDSDGTIITDIDLLQKLKTIRFALATKYAEPAYWVATNAELARLATYMPTTREEYTSIRGLGERKYEKYGELIIAEIIKHKSSLKSP